MRYRFQWFIHLRAHTAYKEGRWAPRLHFSRDMAHFTFTLSDSRQSGTGRPMQSKILPKISITDVKDALYHFEVSASFGVDDPECTEHPRNSEQHEHRQCARQTRSVTSLAACCLYTSRQHCKLHALCTLQCRRYQHFNYTARQKKGTTFLLRINLLIRNVIWQNLVLIIVNEYYHWCYLLNFWNLH